MTIELNRDWTEFLHALISRRVRFLMIGGHAVAAHGEPRMTEDLDVLVEPTLPNARRLRAALIDFGFGAVAPPVSELARKGKVFMLGRKPWRIDILTTISGVSFARAWSGRVELKLGAKSFHVLGRDALLKNKRASGRDRDLRDVAMLEEHAPRPKKPAKAKARATPATPKKRRPEPKPRVRPVSKG